jgi:hypothetical protein
VNIQGCLNLVDQEVNRVRIILVSATSSNTCKDIMADMEVDPPVASSSGPAAGKKKKQDGPRFEVKKVC